MPAVTDQPACVLITEQGAQQCTTMALDHNSMASVSDTILGAARQTGQRPRTGVVFSERSQSHNRDELAAACITVLNAPAGVAKQTEQLQSRDCGTDRRPAKLNLAPGSARDCVQLKSRCSGKGVRPTVCSLFTQDQIRSAFVEFLGAFYPPSSLAEFAVLGNSQLFWQVLPTMKLHPRTSHKRLVVQITAT